MGFAFKGSRGFVSRLMDPELKARPFGRRFPLDKTYIWNTKNYNIPDKRANEVTFPEFKN